MHIAYHITGVHREANRIDVLQLSQQFAIESPRELWQYGYGHRIGYLP